MPKLHGACCCVSGDEPPPCAGCDPVFGVSSVRNISACCMRTEEVETYDTDGNPTGNFQEVNLLSFSLTVAITGPAGLYGTSAYPNPAPNSECGQLPGNAFVASPSSTKVLSIQGSNIITGYPFDNTPVTSSGYFGDYPNVDGLDFGVPYSLYPLARQRNVATATLFCPLETYVTPPCDYCSCGCTCDGDQIGIGGTCGCVGDICSPDDYPPIPHPCGQCFPAERCGGEPGGAAGTPPGTFSITTGGSAPANPGGCNGTAFLGLIAQGSLGGASFYASIQVRGGPGSGSDSEDATGTFSCPHQGSYLTGYAEIDGWECSFDDGVLTADASSHVFRPVADFFDCIPGATLACSTCDCGFCRASMTFQPVIGSCIEDTGTASCSFSVN
jgi:hypothetical protein